MKIAFGMLAIDRTDIFGLDAEDKNDGSSWKHLLSL